MGLRQAYAAAFAAVNTLIVRDFGEASFGAISIEPSSGEKAFLAEW